MGNQTNAFVSLPCSHFPVQPSRRPCRAGWKCCFPAYWQARLGQAFPAPPRDARTLPVGAAGPSPPRGAAAGPGPRAPSRSALLGPRRTAALKAAGEGKSAEIGCPCQLRRHSSSWAAAEPQLGTQEPLAAGETCRRQGRAGDGACLAVPAQVPALTQCHGTRLVQGDLTPPVGAKGEPRTGPHASVPPLTGG